MSKRLANGMRDYETRKGMEGRLKMALAAGVGERMVRRFAKGESVPTSDQAFNIAKCWGASDDDALAIAREYDSNVAKDNKAG